MTDLLKYANHLTDCRYRGGHDCDCGLDEIREAHRTGALAQSVQVPAGWRLVPVDPTQEMVRHAYAVQPGAINAGFAQAYRDMLEAAPYAAQPPAAPVEVDPASTFTDKEWHDALMGDPHPRSSAGNVDAIAKTIWLSEFERAFSRTPSDPWENQSDKIKDGHRLTAQRLIDAGFVTATEPQTSGVWQPIETAPTVEWGKSVDALVYSQQLGIKSAAIGSNNGYVFANVGSYHGNAVESWGVTHWMPLPSSPLTRPEQK